jgi:hypothetical protein
VGERGSPHSTARTRSTFSVFCGKERARTHSRERGGAAGRSWSWRRAKREDRFVVTVSSVSLTFYILSKCNNDNVISVFIRWLKLLILGRVFSAAQSQIFGYTDNSHIRWDQVSLFTTDKIIIVNFAIRTEIRSLYSSAVEPKHTKYWMILKKRRIKLFPYLWPNPRGSKRRRVITMMSNRYHRCRRLQLEQLRI